MPPTRNLIFDFDGVIGDSWDACIAAVSRMDQVTIDEAAADVDRVFSRPHRYSRKADPTPEKLKEKLAWCHAYVAILEELGFNLFDGFVEELKRISNARMAIVSSTLRQCILDRVQGTGLHFTHILGFDDHHSKEHKVEQVCADWQVGLKDVYYFTDTQTDVMELEELLDKRKIIGCSWGYQSYEKLLEILPPEQVLRSFSEIHRVIQP